MLIPWVIIGIWLARPTPTSSFVIEVQMDRIEQIGGEHLLDLSGIRVRKYNRTMSVINGTYSIVRDLDESLAFTVTVARSALGNNQFNEYPMKIPRKDGCRIFLEDYTEYQHVWANTTNLPQVDKEAPPALCALPKGDYWVKDFAPDASWVPPVVPEGFWRMTWHMYSVVTDELEGQVRLFIRVKKDII
ncbi:hypothetical protein pipiens_015715 [Culex pipiens pipiens]|uniref:Uncharacterized protein n=1 Tax=Culex pipiens pipiens TaxID=38569 RepID=A0ABD1CPF8_CULPP